MSIRQKILFLGFIILAGNGFIGYAYYKSNQKLISSEKWVQHSMDVISKSGNISSLIEDIESASRGFVITNDSKFLEPLLTAKEIIFLNIGQLRELLQDDPQQQQRLDSINFYIQERLDFSMQQVKLRENQGLASAIAYTSTSRGMYYSERVREITKTLQLEESNLLKKSKQTNEQSELTRNWISGIMFVFMSVITILLLIVEGKNLVQNKNKVKRAGELNLANKELAFQNEEKEKRASELIVANEELIFQNDEKEKRAGELIIANTELAFQNQEKENRAAELIIANKELAFQNEEKEKRASELIVANKELVFQNDEKEKRAGELIIANTELAFQNQEKENRAAELIIANKELAFQNEEKGKRSDELIIAYQELIFQNKEKEKRADELIIAEKELVFQNDEKEKRADELIIANTELAFQNQEKENRASELIIANKELVFQNKEKGKRAAELITANEAIVFQSEEKEKQEAANKELEAFSYSVSHDLRAPLRHIGGFVDLLIRNNSSQLDVSGLRYLKIISESSVEMGNLIDALLTFSRLSRTELKQTKINSKNMVTRVIDSFSDELVGRNVEINVLDLPDTTGDETLINQVWINLISNALKYSKNKENAVIDIGATVEKDKSIFFVKDNGAGFDMKYADKLFGVFQRLHKAKDFEGIGIGLANVNRIVVRHGGMCRAESEVDQGATFFFSMPN